MLVPAGPRPSLKGGAGESSAHESSSRPCYDVVKSRYILCVRIIVDSGGIIYPYTHNSAGPGGKTDRRARDECQGSQNLPSRGEFGVAWNGAAARFREERRYLSLSSRVCRTLE